MAEDANKENFAGGLLQPHGASVDSIQEPRKKYKTRSLSMGPGAAAEKLKEESGNRRKSMMPAVKSILSTANETKTADEAAKRKAARRKSLANRRVSFAPEATLHTWDVIEYMRDATSSSASSEEARRASSISQAEPQTPTLDLGSEIDTIFSARDAELDVTTASQDVKDTNHTDDHILNFDQSSSDDGETTEDDGEAEGSAADASDSTSSSAKLDDALRQASAVAKANTQNFVIEDEDDQTMEIAGDEVTSAFRPWFNQNRRDSVGIRKAVAANNKENENSARFAQGHLDEVESSSENESTDDATMDVTMALGGIIQQQAQVIAHAEQTKSLKRRRSSASMTVAADSSGSPVARPNTRRSLTRRQSSTEETIVEDETMDFTMAIGGIKQVAREEELDITAQSLLDQTMDFTMPVGKIREVSDRALPEATDRLANTEKLEDLSMELTANLGKALAGAIKPVTRSPLRAMSSVTMPILPSAVIIERNVITVEESLTLPDVAFKQDHKHASPRRNVLPNLLFDTVTTPTSANTAVQATKNAPEAVATPPQHNLTLPLPTEAGAAKSSLSDTLRLLLTPRKEILPTPSISQSSKATPKRTTPARGFTPTKRSLESNRYVSPRKRVRMESEEPSDAAVSASGQEGDAANAIGLPDFLQMTGIRFMDLTTTKRRATGYPGADGTIFKAADDTIEELEPSMENKIAAAVSITPMMQMYQHSCQEMKSYIASGRTDIKNIELAALASQPPLFHDYANASFAEKSIMDNQLRDLKTNARLQSKSGWHTWRSQLLNDLKNGLLQTAEELEQDAKVLGPVEKSFSEVTPLLERQHEELQSSLRSLQQRKQDVEDGREADLDDARTRLLATQSELKQKKILLQRLQSELAEKSSRLDDARSWKIETIGAIKEADRVNEECRGWSTEEVLALNEKLVALEKLSGWSLTSAAGSSITLKHMDLQLTLDPRSWLSKSNSPSQDSSNSPISISYIGDDADDVDTPTATVRRFFLQYIRAQAYALPQYCTRITQLTALIQHGWRLGSSILAAVQSLELSGQTNAHILGDEKLGIEAFMFLPMLQTKIRVLFLTTVSTDSEQNTVNGTVEVSAEVVYGERYDEPKMASFLQMSVPSGKVGSDVESRKWADGLDELKDRLVRTGRKGVRRV